MYTGTHAQDFTPGKDSRREARRRTLRRARVVVNRSGSTFDALVRDISDSGARLKLPTFWAVPETFELEILTSLGTLEKSVTCEKRWQIGERLGAKFILSSPNDRGNP